MMIRRPHVLELVLSFVIGMLGLAVSVWGQDNDSGAIQGWVLDTEGLPLPGVEVHLSSEAMPTERVCVSQASGGYRFSALPPGHYTLEARLPGFQTATVENVRVGVNKTSFISLEMRLEGMACEVMVTAEAPAQRPGRGQPRRPSFQAYSTSEVESHDNDAYSRIDETGFVDPREQPLSTFSVDVDTASYANVRRFLQVGGTLPPVDAVRIEEMLNYFTDPLRDGSPRIHSGEGNACACAIP